MAKAGAPRILCVDDEPNITEGLKLQLYRSYQVVTSNSPVTALEMVRHEGPFAVVVSDMRMPEIDGVTLLGRVRKLCKETVRILLTGNNDLETAIQAVNQGEVFRFLNKPCPSEMLLKALAEAVSQHELLVSERVLLEQTLHGSIQALTDVLALAHPAAFSRGSRIKRCVGLLAGAAGVPDRWQVEVAAMLSQIGLVTLPGDTVDRLSRGEDLSADERQMVKRAPEVSAQLIAHIPRLEAVQEMLLHQDEPFAGGAATDPMRGEKIRWGARALRLATDFDELESQGTPLDLAIGILTNRKGKYDPALIQLLAQGVGGHGETIRSVRLQDLHKGMVLAQDVHTRSGVLLIGRGQELTLGHLTRLRNFAETTGVKEPIRVGALFRNADGGARQAA